MKKLFGLILFLSIFAFSADVKPFVFEGVAKDSATQQDEYNYMLKYKLFGRDYITIGNDVVIQDQSGWNGTAGYMTANARLSLGGPVLVNETITFGDQPTLTSGPVRAQTYTYGNQNGACINGIVCLDDVSGSKVNHCETGMVYNSTSQICTDNVPDSPKNLSIPTITWPDTITQSIIFDNQLNGDIKTIVVPDGKDQYDIYLDTIQFKLDHQKLQIEMQDGGRLTRIFVKHFLYHDHGQIQVVYRTDSTKYELTQKDYRGNVIIYTDESISIEHSDNSIMQGTMISTKEIYLACNINFAGQLLANQLRIGDTYNGENFRFVKFDPDTLDFPELNKQGGLYEDNQTVIIPIELSDTTDIDVFFTYCFDLKDGVTIDDFNIPPAFPVCGESSITTKIPIGSKTPVDTIKVNVKKDTLVEPNEYLVLRIDSISGAVLPNGKTSGELKIKINDAPVGHVEFDTTYTYKFAENDTGFVDTIKTLNKTATTRFYLDSSFTDRYTLDSITGVLTLVGEPLDYEKAITDVVKITLTDTGNVKVTRNIPITVLDVNEAPTLDDVETDLPENLIHPFMVVKLVAEDVDTKPEFTQNIFIMLEGDTSLFRVDSDGEVWAKKTFDYETDQKTHTIKVLVQDKNNPALKDSAIVTISITNSNDGPKFDTHDTTFYVNENEPFKDSVKATDQDGDKITYSIVGTVPFTIDSNGVITSTRTFDFEKETEFTFKVVASDGTAKDTMNVTVKINDVNEPVHTKDTTCSVKENYTGNVCKITGTDDDGTKPTFIVTDTTNYKIDSTGQLVIKNPIDYEKKTKDTVKVIVTDGEFSDTATVIINVIDVDEIPEITKIDDKPPVDTLKTNNPDHKIDFKICEGNKCYIDSLDVTIKKDTTIKVCNVKKTVCDSVVILFNNVPPVVTLTNAKSTSAKIDYITIEEQKDNKIYVNKKTNQITVTVKDTTHKTEKHFDIEVKLDTIPTKDIKLSDYHYLIDDTKAIITPIGNNRAEMVETIKDNGVVITISQIIDLNTRQTIDTVQIVTYTKKINGKDVVVTYNTDNITGKRISDYNISYMVDSCTKVTYTMNDKNQIVKNDEGNIAYTVSYDYIDDFGNKASASVEIVFDDIPPVVEILEPTAHSVHKKNAIEVKWTVNGEIQDTLTLQRLEKGPNTIIRRYVDKAGNESSDTILVIMKEAKDIDIHIINPVTEINQNKVNEYYGNGNKYNSEKPFRMISVDPKTDTLPETIGIGFVVDIALPTVSPTGSLATLDDLIHNGQIPVDDKGNIVGASTKGITVEEYVENHCTEEFKQDYRKNGVNIPLYDVKYKLNLWIYTSNAGYVNDFTIDYTLNDESLASEAGTVKMVIDWLADTDGEVKASNHKALGSEAYITKLYSTSVAKHRCDFKNQLKGQKTIKKDETMKTFGYKRPKNK